MIRALALSMAIGVAACAPTPKAPAVTGNMGCGEAKLAGLIGKVWTESMRAETLKRSGDRTLRIIAPDTVVTMDYRPDRLNVHTDREGRITHISCG